MNKNMLIFKTCALLLTSYTLASDTTEQVFDKKPDASKDIKYAATVLFKMSSGTPQNTIRKSTELDTLYNMYENTCYKNAECKFCGQTFYCKKQPHPSNMSRHQKNCQNRSLYQRAFGYNAVANKRLMRKNSYHFDESESD